MSYDEKTTELELPVRRNNIVHVNFLGSRSPAQRTRAQRAANTAPAQVRRLHQPKKAVNPWVLRLLALAALVALSYFVL